MFDLERQLQAVQAECRSLLEKEIPAYNKTIGGGLTPLKTMAQ